MPVSTSKLRALLGKEIVASPSPEQIRAAMERSVSDGVIRRPHPRNFPTWTPLETADGLVPYPKAFDAYHWSPRQWDQPNLDTAGSVAGSRDGNAMYFWEHPEDGDRWLHGVAQRGFKPGQSPHPDWVPGIVGNPGVMPFGYHARIHTPKAGLPLYHTAISRQTPKLQRVFDAIGDKHGISTSGMNPKSFGEALLAEGVPGGRHHPAMSPLQDALLDKNVPGMQAYLDREAYPDMPDHERYGSRVYMIHDPRVIQMVRRVPYALAPVIAAGAGANNERPDPSTAGSPTSLRGDSRAR